MNRREGARKILAPQVKTKRCRKEQAETAELAAFNFPDSGLPTQEGRWRV